MRFVREGIEQEAADAARSFLSNAWDTHTLRDVLPNEPLPEHLWNQAGEMGWFDLLVPEPEGGLGLGVVEAGAVLEESGRALFPGPLLDTVVLHGLVRKGLGLAPTDRVALAVAEQASRGLPSWADTAVHKGVVTGHKHDVAYADRVDGLAVMARTDDGHPAFVLVDPKDVAVEVQSSVDPVHRPCVVSLDGAPVRASVEGEEAAAVLERVEDLAWTLVSSRLLGVAERLLEQACSYAAEREQFGRPIGSFQAVRHRLAEDRMLVTSARSACYLAQARVEAREDGARRAARVAKAHLSAVGRRVAEDALQVHGGIGFTIEHDLHLFLKHALTLQGLWGDEAHHELAVADELIAHIAER